MAIPNAPSNLQAVLRPVGAGFKWDDDDQVALIWTDNSDDETSFEMQLSNEPTFSSPATFDPIAADAVTFVDSGRAPNVILYYRIRAKNGDGDSDWSNTASVRTVITGRNGSALANRFLSPGRR